MNKEIIEINLTNNKEFPDIQFFPELEVKLGMRSVYAIPSDFTSVFTKTCHCEISKGAEILLVI